MSEPVVFSAEQLEEAVSKKVNATRAFIRRIRRALLDGNEVQLNGLGKLKVVFSGDAYHSDRGRKSVVFEASDLMDAKLNPPKFGIVMPRSGE